VRFLVSFPCDHLFDQPQAVLHALDQADEVRIHGAVGVILSWDAVRRRSLLHSA
jgi:hypothetical protein